MDKQANVVEGKAWSDSLNKGLEKPGSNKISETNGKKGKKNEQKSVLPLSGNDEKSDKNKNRPGEAPVGQKNHEVVGYRMKLVVVQ